MGRPWLFSAPLDLALLYLPVWAVWLLCFGLEPEILARPLPLWVWAVFIVGIDVAHVWSTLFRTYLDREEFGLHRPLLLYTPWLVFALAFAVPGSPTCGSGACWPISPSSISCASR